MKVGIRHWHWHRHWLLCSTSVPPSVPNMREVEKEIRPISAHPGDPHNPGHPPKPFRPARSLHRLFTLLPGLSRYQDRHQHVRDAQDNIKRLWCFWWYFKYIIISSHVTMMDMIIWWCAGHSHTGELQVFDCINLASRVSPFLHQPLPYTTAEKQFFNSFFFPFSNRSSVFLLSQSFTPVRRASPMNLIWESHLSGIRSFNFNFSSFCKFDPIQCKGEENDCKSIKIHYSTNLRWGAFLCLPFLKMPIQYKL